MPARATAARETPPEARPGDADSKERILAAALQAFSELGFDGATTREIAQRAGVNLGLIQYYFEGKENLWRASVERAFAELRGGLDAIRAEAGELDDRERVRRLLRSFVGFTSRKPEFVRIMHDEGKRDGPRMRWLVENHVRDFFEETRTMLVRTGALAENHEPADFVALHYVLIGALALLHHQAEECKYLTGMDPAEPAMVDAHVRTLERLLLGPPQEENAS